MITSYIWIVMIIIIILGLIYSDKGVYNRKYKQIGGEQIKVEADVTLVEDKKMRTNGNSNLISGLEFSSNTGIDEFESDRSVKYASFDTDKAWGGDPDKRFLTYLEIKLPTYYHLEGILTRGFEGQMEWVSEFFIEYWDDYYEIWKKSDKLYKGNVNDKDIAFNHLDLNTSKIRIYPITWEKFPSLKVSLTGKQLAFMKCLYYEIQSMEGPMERRGLYKNLYNDNCIKVDSKDYIKLQNELRVYQSELEKARQLLADETKNGIKSKENSVPRDQLYELANKFREYKNKVENKVNY